MRNQLLEVEKDRFYLNDPCKYSVCGIIPEKYTIGAYLDGTKVESSTEKVIARTAMERFRDGEMLGGQRVETTVRLPKDLEKYKKLEFFAVFEGKKSAWFQVKTAELLRRRGKPQFFIEEERVDRKAGTLSIRGWAAAVSHVSIRLFDEHKNPVECQVQRLSRVDVVELFRECEVEEKCGFYIELENIKGKYLYLVMRTKDGNKAVHKVALGAFEILQGKAGKYRKKAFTYLRAHGVKALAVKSLRKVSEVTRGPVDYSKWLPRHLPTASELDKQRKEVFSYNPKISIVVCPCIRQTRNF